jgi:hypothetical protein
MPEENEEKVIPENSILESVKKDLGASEWDDAFDDSLIRCINSVFMILSQLGVGPYTGFSIDGPEDTWDDYETMGADVGAVKSYLSKKVKIMFDPSQSSFVNESDKAICNEFEWRLNVAVDPG